MIMRMVARAAYHGKNEDFERWWVVEHSVIDKKVWGSPEDAAELKAKIEKAHGIKLT